MGDGKVEYIEFGGVLVPSDSRRTTIPDETTGKKLYCVFLDYNGTKITYPEQKIGNVSNVQYLRLHTNGKRVSEKNISKNLFETYWNKVRNEEGSFPYHDVKSYYKRSGFDTDTSKQYRQIEMQSLVAGVDVYMECPVNPTPRIEYQTEGLLFDTKKVKLFNLTGAKYEGSNDEDDVTTENCTNCTLDVHDYNNNIFISDKVKIINGSGNKVRSGDYDKAIFATYDYTTATETIKKKVKDEGEFKQPK